MRGSDLAGPSSTTPMETSQQEPSSAQAAGGSARRRTQEVTSPKSPAALAEERFQAAQEMDPEALQAHEEVSSMAAASCSTHTSLQACYHP